MYNVQWRRCRRNGTASGKSPRNSPFISVFQVQEIKLQICRVCEISFLMLAFKPFIYHSLGSQSYLVWMLTSNSFLSLSFFILSFFASPFFLFAYLYSMYPWNLSFVHTNVLKDVLLYEYIIPSHYSFFNVDSFYFCTILFCFRLLSSSMMKNTEPYLNILVLGGVICSLKQG